MCEINCVKHVKQTLTANNQKKYVRKLLLPRQNITLHSCFPLQTSVFSHPSLAGKKIFTWKKVLHITMFYKSTSSNDISVQPFWSYLKILPNMYMSKKIPRSKSFYTLYMTR